MSDSEDDDDIFGDKKSSDEVSPSNKGHSGGQEAKEKKEASDDDDDDDDDDEDEEDDKDDDKKDDVIGRIKIGENKLDTSSLHSPDSEGSDSDEEKSGDDLSETESDADDKSPFPYIFSIDQMKKMPLDKTSPEDLLAKATRKANLYAKKKWSNKCVHECIRCVALTRIVFGVEHWKMVEAHVQLASVYLEQKGYTSQVVYHVEIAKDILTKNVNMVEFAEDKQHIVFLLMNMQYLLGRAYTIESKLAEAKAALKRADSHYAEYEQIVNHAKSKSRKNEWQLKLALAFGRLYFKLNCQSEAMKSFEKALRICTDQHGKKSPALISIYQSLGKVEQSKGNRADEQKIIDYFLEAHSIAMSKYGDRSVEVADTGYEVALAYANLTDADAELSAETYLKEAIEGYRQCLGDLHEKTLEAEDELSRLLIRTDNIEAGIQRLVKSIVKKEEKYGWFSSQVGDSYKLIGSSYQALGNAQEAAKAFEKCVQVETVVYGSSHKRTIKTQANIKLISPKSKPPSSAGRRASSARR